MLTFYKKSIKTRDIPTQTKNGIQVLSIPEMPTYFPQKNIQKASLIIFQFQLSLYFIKFNAMAT